MSDFGLFDNSHYENFSTSLLVFAMRQSPDFALGVMNLIQTRMGKPNLARVKFTAIEREYRIDAPRSKRPRRPDIYVEADVGGRLLKCLIEAKIQSREGESQLVDDRSWLESEKADEKALVTITRDAVEWSSKPDAALRWADLRPLVAQMIECTEPGSFAWNFWAQLKEHWEEVMPAFEGFSLGFSNVHRLMKEVGLFLDAVLDRAGVTKVYDDWRKNRAAYWLPNEQATVGFYWWQPGGDASEENTLFVIKEGPEKRKTRIASFQEIVAEAAVAKQDDRLDQCVGRIAAKVREALGSPLPV